MFAQFGGKGILDKTLPGGVTLFELAVGTPLLWEEQSSGGSRLGSIQLKVGYPIYESV